MLYLYGNIDFSFVLFEEEEGIKKKKLICDCIFSYVKLIYVENVIKN